LDKGKIAARGTHAELMETSPIYADIYHSQLTGDRPPPPADDTGQPAPAPAEVAP
jgi:ATP-binding cassette subfamily B protein